MLTAFLRDLRYGMRMLALHPGFTCVAVLTLALGIGAVSAIFTVVNSVLLEPLHFYRPGQLVVVSERNLIKGFPQFSVSAGNYRDYRDHNHTFSGMAAMEETAVNLSGFTEPERLTTAGVTSEFFAVMGTQPALGRTFNAAEGKFGGEHVVILSHGVWQRRFGGKSSVLGQKLKLDAELYTVVGVMPAGFTFPDQTELWAPFTLKEEGWQQRGSHGLDVIARLQDGVPIDAAQADLDTIAARAAQTYPDTNTGWEARLQTLQEAEVGDVRLAILTLAAAVGFVLLIACANLANLLLSRSAARRHEIGIRGALGAGRGRLVRQLLTESLLLAALGTVSGLGLAYAGTHLLVNVSTDILPRAKEIAVDGRVLGATAAIAVLTVVLFGLAPAVLIARIDVHSALRGGGGHGHSLGFRRNRLRSVLVIGEVALSLVLLSCSGLLLRSFYRLRTIDPGFDTRGVLMFRTDLPEAQYKSDEQRAEFYDRALERVRALPGVTAAGVAQTFPLADTVIILSFEQLGRAPVPAGNRPSTAFNTVSPEYFAALRIPLKAGRYFTSHDDAYAAGVAIISERIARQYYGNENPLGQRLAIGNRKPAEIVGIVGDVRDRQLDTQGRGVVYKPAAQAPDPTMFFAVRTAGNPAALTPAARSVIRQLDSELCLDAVGTVADLVDRSLSQRRFAMRLMAAFAGLALALAMVGIYGVMSHSVTQATKEIGIRMALGAEGVDVLRMVLNYGGRLMAGGLLLGVPMALGAGRLLASQLFEVPPGDPTTYALVMASLLGTGLAACMIPALRATRVDPMLALRNE